MPENYDRHTSRPMTYDEMIAHPLVRVAGSGSWLDSAR